MDGILGTCLRMPHGLSPRDGMFNDSLIFGDVGISSSSDQTEESLHSSEEGRRMSDESNTSSSSLPFPAATMEGDFKTTNVLVDYSEQFGTKAVIQPSTVVSQNEKSNPPFPIDEFNAPFDKSKYKIVTLVEKHTGRRRKIKVARDRLPARLTGGAQTTIKQTIISTAPETHLPPMTSPVDYSTTLSDHFPIEIERAMEPLAHSYFTPSYWPDASGLISTFGVSEKLSEEVTHPPAIIKKPPRKRGPRPSRSRAAKVEPRNEQPEPQQCIMRDENIRDDMDRDVTDTVLIRQETPYSMPSLTMDDIIPPDPLALLLQANDEPMNDLYWNGLDGCQEVVHYATLDFHGDVNFANALEGPLASLSRLANMGI